MKNPFEFIEKEHFIQINDSLIAKELFKKSIQMVEIETFSFCNRKCWFCPNSFIDRTSSNTYLPEDIYLFILNQLASIDYANMISYSRYNEPLADRIILTRLKQAKDMLPNVLLHMNSNGDYITPEYLESLSEAGLRSLNIQAYFSKEEEYTEDDANGKIKDILNKLSLNFEVRKHEVNDWIEANGSYKEIRIRIYSRNFSENGCNRGGLITGTKETCRISPCIVPFNSIYIDYNANVVPCCNIRSDAPEHKAFIVGNISKSTIFDIYTGYQMAEWRKSLFNYLEKHGPCSNCLFLMFDESYNIQVQEKLSKIFNV